ncbi:glycerol dehydrogenase [Oceanobacillus rekensis]|uniref:glycerol dehydrogenase n=1 Tax=Oceanobacillus rekensis TaxID=937927 RepID=UPI000B44D616|nr:glycerol dehydrogenase [Oceanobacillus rekensis]
MQKRVFIATNKYVQGAGILSKIGDEVKVVGKKPIILADSTVWGIVGSTVENSFESSNTSYHYEEFQGESSNSEFNRLTKIAKDNEADVVIGLGGGKTIDTAKVVADNLGISVVIVPTTASMDAPTTAISVVYSDDGTFEGYKFYNKNPDLVLVDPQVIVGAPVHLFASGMGDAVATSVEARASQKRNSITMAGGIASIAGRAIAQKAEEVIFEHGIAAFKAVKKGLVTPSVEEVIEANTLLSGVGAENGGVAAAHAIHDGFTALDGEIHHMTHGQKVAYGVLVQLVLEGVPETEVMRYANLFKALELPTTLKELHLEDVSFDDLVKVGEIATSKKETLVNMDPKITPDEVANAILAVNEITTSNL